MGIIHLIATNLSLWINQVVDEAAKVILETQNAPTHVRTASNADVSSSLHSVNPKEDHICLAELLSMQDQLSKNCVGYFNHSVSSVSSTGESLLVSVNHLLRGHFEQDCYIHQINFTLFVMMLILS